jgi:hypothetical protein
LRRGAGREESRQRPGGKSLDDDRTAIASGNCSDNRRINDQGNTIVVGQNPGNGTHRFRLPVAYNDDLPGPVFVFSLETYEVRKISENSNEAARAASSGHGANGSVLIKRKGSEFE